MKKTIIETLKSYDNHFTKLVQYHLEVNENNNPNSFDDNSNDQNNNNRKNQLLLIDHADIIKNDVIEHIVKNAERQLRDVINKYKMDLIVYSLKLFIEMIDDE